MQVGQGLLLRVPARLPGGVGLFQEEAAHPLPQHLPVQEVPGPDPHPSRPVGVGGANAPARGAHEVVAAFHVLVVREDQVGPLRDQDLGMEPLLPQVFHLLLEAEGVNDHPVSQHIHRVGVDDPGGGG